MDKTMADAADKMACGSREVLESIHTSDMLPNVELCTDFKNILESILGILCDIEGSLFDVSEAAAGIANMIG